VSAYFDISGPNTLIPAIPVTYSDGMLCGIIRATMSTAIRIHRMTGTGGFCAARD
jgi:hypothetical protein